MTPLRVGFNAYLQASPVIRGWARYTINLLAVLPAHGVRPVLYSNAPLHADHLARLPPGSFETQVSPPMRYLAWENVWLPRQLKRDRIDLFHCPMNYGMPWFTPCPRVLTLHDAIDQVYYVRRADWRTRWSPSTIRMRLVNWAARTRAHQVITVSEHAKSDIVKHFRIPVQRVTVVHEAADSCFSHPISVQAVDAVRLKYALSRAYFFYVGGWEGRKNLPFLIRAFAKAELQSVDLALAGGKDVERSALFELATQLKCEDRLRFMGFIPDNELPALYAGALAFVYPSEYEGFGLQVCEAMAVGCPVLVARATSLPEIAGSGGESFALDNPAELAALLKRVATEEPYRADLANRARVRSSQFSWEKSAAATMDVYRRALRRTEV